MKVAKPKKEISCPMLSSPASTCRAPNQVSSTRKIPVNSTPIASTAPCQIPAATPALRTRWDWAA